MRPSPPVEHPDITFVMPCYNEEEVIGFTIPQMVDAFVAAGVRLELLAVDNGSQDRTGALLAELASRYPQITPCRVEHNQGYGWGVLSALPRARAPWVGIIPCDGQVDPEDVVRLYQAVAATNGRVVGKVRRRFRMDGLRRKVVSVAYNLFVRALWPGLGSIDVNGSPKILPREEVLAMDLQSRDWLLDPEIMIKAHYRGLRVLELNVFARMRGGGTSHVKASTCLQFFSQLVTSRVQGRWRTRPGSASVPTPRRMPAP